MRAFTVAVLLIACLASRAAASFDIASLDKVWLDLDQESSNTEEATDKGAGAPLQAEGDAKKAYALSAGDTPQEGDPIDKYLLKDTADFKIARDSNGRPILLSSVEAAGGLPLLYGANGHGVLVQASSDYNFSTEAVPAGEPDAVKASDLGGKFDPPRSAPQAANPPTPPATTKLSWPAHRPVLVEHTPWPAPVSIYKSGHSHHSHSHHPHYEHWSSEQKPVAADAPQDGPWNAPQAGPQSAAPLADGPWNAPQAAPQPAAAPLADGPWNGPQSAEGPQFEPRPESPSGSYRGAPSSRFEQEAPQAFNPSSAGPGAPWESVRSGVPKSPEGPFWNEQAFLGVSRAQPNQG